VELAPVKFHAGALLPNEEHVDATIHDFFEETGMTITVDDITMF
jgi:hypothetical protein